MKPSLDEQLDPPPPLLASAAARVAFSLAAQEVSDFAAAMVSTQGDTHALPGEFITQVRQLRKMHVYMMTRTVLLERARGAAWGEIAAAMGYAEAWVRGNYEPAEKRWLAIIAGAPLPEPETLTEALELPPDNAPVTEAEIRKAARELDEWCRRRAAAIAAITPDDTVTGRPVSEGIERH